VIVATFESRFGFGDKVRIDGDLSVVGTVIGFCFYPHVAQVQVSWWNSGALVEQWIAPWRLETTKGRSSCNTS
jgi:hypothetical protein